MPPSHARRSGWKTGSSAGRQGRSGSARSRRRPAWPALHRPPVRGPAASTRPNASQRGRRGATGRRGCAPMAAAGNVHPHHQRHPAEHGSGHCQAELLEPVGVDGGEPTAVAHDRTRRSAPPTMRVAAGRGFLLEISGRRCSAPCMSSQAPRRPARGPSGSDGIAVQVRHQVGQRPGRSAHPGRHRDEQDGAVGHRRTRPVSSLCRPRQAATCIGDRRAMPAGPASRSGPVTSRKWATGCQPSNSPSATKPCR